MSNYIIKHAENGNSIEINHIDNHQDITVLSLPLMDALAKWIRLNWEEGK